MEFRSALASSTLKTGVLPRLTTWAGPLTGAAGLVGNQPKILNVPFAPRQKLSAGPCVRFTRVQVPDPGREKLEELGRRVFAGVGQDRGHGVGVAEGQCVHSGVKECPIPAY